MSFSLSGMVDRPMGVANLPLPSEIRPEELMRKRCPLRTTSPLLFHPLFVLSARTATLIVKNVGEALGLVVLGLLACIRLRV